MRLLRFTNGRLTVDALSMVELLETIEMLAAFDDGAIVMVVSGKDSGVGATVGGSRQEPIDAGNPTPESELYIQKRDGVGVFDPRFITEDDDCREAQDNTPSLR